jgi:glycosyl transferase family 4
VRPLSILFTNNTLAQRAGSEIWVRDVARALVRRGHRPIAFSLVTGPVATELRDATVPVVSDLANVAHPPDLIHGHHHVETLIAALHFPGVPIVHFCHSWALWEERPLKHPAIARYVAVDRTCSDRLVWEEGIPADRVDLLLNFVDLDRFRPRDPLPVRPRRALVFGNEAREDGFVAVIREACRDAGVEVTIAGSASGRVLDRPEAALPEFDLVFAKARAALEAMAVGCSVILADPRGVGPLVTSAEFDRCRALNFGARLLQEPHHVSVYREQIARYDAVDAALVSARVRAEAGLDAAVDRLLEIYTRTLDDDASRTARGESTPCLEAQRAASRHLAWMASHLKNARDLAAHAGVLAADLTSAHALNQTLAGDRDRLAAQRDQLTAERDGLAAARDRLSAERDQRAAEQDRASVERNQLAEARDRLAADRDGLAAALDQLTTERDQLSARVERHIAAEALTSGEARRDREALIARYEALPSLRIRNAWLRMPLLGSLARHSARWIAARVPRRDA